MQYHCIIYYYYDTSCRQPLCLHFAKYRMEIGKRQMPTLKGLRLHNNLKMYL